MESYEGKTTESVTKGFQDQQPNNELVKRLNHEKVQRLIPVIIYMCIVMIVLLVGNGHVCYIYRPKRYMKSSRWFVFVLGGIDLFSCAIMFPTVVVPLFYQFNFEDEHFCKLTAFFTLWPTLCMGFTLLVVSVDRYRKICKHGGWQINLRHAKIATSVIVLVSFICTLGAPIFGLIGLSRSVMEKENFNVTITKCTFQSTNVGPARFKFWYILTGLGLFVTAVVIMIVLNCLTGARIFRQTKEMKSFSQNGLNSIQARKASISMMLVCMAFVISYLPFLILVIVRSYTKDFEKTLSAPEIAVYTIFLRSYIISCSINPLIYLISDTHFRKECKEILPAMFKRCSRKLKYCNTR